MAHHSITMNLTAGERGLLLRYGYSISQSEAALRACAESHDIECVPIDRFNLRHLIADLCYSINSMGLGRKQDELLAPCDRLEAAERYSDAAKAISTRPESLFASPAALTRLQGLRNRRLAGRKR